MIKRRGGLKKDRFSCSQLPGGELLNLSRTVYCVSFLLLFPRSSLSSPQTRESLSMPTRSVDLVDLKGNFPSVYHGKTP